MARKKPQSKATKQKPAHPTVGGKAPRKILPIHQAGNSNQEPTATPKPFPYTKEEALAARVHPLPSKKEQDALNQTEWEDPEHPLLAEQVREPEKLQRGTKIMRVINEFSFYYQRTEPRDKVDPGKKWRPTAPVPGVGEAWSSFMLRGCMASLNGLARYLNMAGEFGVPWPTMQSVPIVIMKDEIVDMAMIDDKLFRDSQKVLSVMTKTHIYILLTPDIFFEGAWRSVIPFWEKYMEVGDLFIEELDHTAPRPLWWHGRDSFIEYRKWKVNYLRDEGKPTGKIDRSGDKPRPDDLDDDLESEDEDEDEDKGGDKEARHASQGGGKTKKKGKEGGERKGEGKPKESPAKGNGKRKDKKGPGGSGKQVQAANQLGSSSKIGTGPPLKLPGAVEQPSTTGLKRKATEDDVGASGASRPRRHETTDRGDKAPEPAQMQAQGFPGASGASSAPPGSSFEGPSLPNASPSPPNLDYMARMMGMNPALGHEPDNTLPVAPHLQGISQGVGGLQLGDGLQWKAGWSLPLPHNMTGQQLSDAMPTDDFGYTTADVSSMSGLDSFPSEDPFGQDERATTAPDAGGQFVEYSKLEAVLLQSKDENLAPYNCAAAHTVYFPS